MEWIVRIRCRKLWFQMHWPHPFSLQMLKIIIYTRMGTTRCREPTAYPRAKLLWAIPGWWHCWNIGMSLSSAWTHTWVMLVSRSPNIPWRACIHLWWGPCIPMWGAYIPLWGAYISLWRTFWLFGNRWWSFYEFVAMVRRWTLYWRLDMAVSIVFSKTSFALTRPSISSGRTGFRHGSKVWRIGWRIGRRNCGRWNYHLVWFRLSDTTDTINLTDPCAWINSWFCARRIWHKWANTFVSCTPLWISHTTWCGRIWKRKSRVLAGSFLLSLKQVIVSFNCWELSDVSKAFSLRFLQDQIILGLTKRWFFWCGFMSEGSQVGDFRLWVGVDLAVIIEVAIPWRDNIYKYIYIYIYMYVCVNLVRYIVKVTIHVSENKYINTRTEHQHSI